MLSTCKLCVGKREEFANYYAEFQLFLLRRELSPGCASVKLYNSNFGGQTDLEYRA